MKLLREGRCQNGWAKEYKCTGHGNNNGGCGAVLLVDETDLFRTFRCCIDETEEFTTFKCPQCGVLTDIKEYHKTRELPSKADWEKKRAEKASTVLDILLTEKEMDDLLMGRSVTQQIISAKFNTPLMDLVIRAKIAK